MEIWAASVNTWARPTTMPGEAGMPWRMRLLSVMFLRTCGQRARRSSWPPPGPGAPVALSTSRVPWGQSRARMASRSRASATIAVFLQGDLGVEVLGQGGDLGHRPGMKAQAVFHPEFPFHYGLQRLLQNIYFIMKIRLGAWNSWNPSQWFGSAGFQPVQGALGAPY